MKQWVQKTKHFHGFTILEMKESIWMTRECWWENRTLHENPHPVDMQERIFKAFLWLSGEKRGKEGLTTPNSEKHITSPDLPFTFYLHNFLTSPRFCVSFIRTLTQILLSQQRKRWTLLSATSFKYGIALASFDWFYLESGSSEASLVFWQF